MDTFWNYLLKISNLKIIYSFGGDQNLKATQRAAEVDLVHVSIILVVNLNIGTFIQPIGLKILVSNNNRFVYHPPNHSRLELLNRTKIKVDIRKTINQYHESAS